MSVSSKPRGTSIFVDNIRPAWWRGGGREKGRKIAVCLASFFPSCLTKSSIVHLELIF